MVAKGETMQTFADTTEALKEMVQKYIVHRKPILAVANVKVREVRQEGRFFGMATIGDAIGDEDHFYSISKLTENPTSTERSDPHSRMIMGRYILTPEIFDAINALEAMGSKGMNEATGRIELTDALSLLRRDEQVCAYEFEPSAHAHTYPSPCGTTS